MIHALAALMLAAQPPAPAPAASGAVCAGVPLATMVARYATLLRAQDVRGIAALFTDDGQIINPGETSIVGPAAITAYLGRFSAYKVASETMELGEVSGTGADWRAEGRFRQSGTMPDKRPYTTSGRFVSDWTCAPEGQWRLRRMQMVG